MTIIRMHYFYLTCTQKACLHHGSNYHAQCLQLHLHSQSQWVQLSSLMFFSSNYLHLHPSMSYHPLAASTIITFWQGCSQSPMSLASGSAGNGCGGIDGGSPPVSWCSAPDTPTMANGNLSAFIHNCSIHSHIIHICSICNDSNIVGSNEVTVNVTEPMTTTDKHFECQIVKNVMSMGITTIREVLLQGISEGLEVTKGDSIARLIMEKQSSLSSSHPNLLTIEAHINIIISVDITVVSSFSADGNYSSLTLCQHSSLTTHAIFWHSRQLAIKIHSKIKSRTNISKNQKQNNE